MSIFLFLSCNNKRNKILNLSKDELVRQIARENIVAGGAVGIAGIEPDQWVRYTALKSKSSEQELIDLADHPNNAVKCYAFTALIEMKSKKIFELLLKNITDTGKVKTFYGCIMSSQPVGEFYIQNVLDGRNLGILEKQILDSVVLFNGDSNLVARFNIVETIQIKPGYYDLIKSRAAQYPEYVVALSRYKNPAAKKFISDLLKNPNHSIQYFGLRAVTHYPDKIFFPALNEIAKNNYKTLVEDQSDYLRVLYIALVQYKNQTSRDILAESIQNATGMDSIKKIDLVYDALKVYPDGIYKNLIEYY